METFYSFHVIARLAINLLRNKNGWVVKILLSRVRLTYENIAPFYRTTPRMLFKRFRLSAATINSHYSRKSFSQLGHAPRGHICATNFHASDKSVLLFFFFRNKQPDASLTTPHEGWSRFRVPLCTSLNTCQYFVTLLIWIGQSSSASLKTAEFLHPLFVNLLARHVIPFHAEKHCLIPRERHKNCGNDFAAVTILCMRERTCDCDLHA